MRLCASVLSFMLSIMRIRQTSHTGSDEDEGCSRVDNARSGRKDGGRSAVTYGLVDAPEIARRKCLGEGAFMGFIHPNVSAQILQTHLATGTYVNATSPVNFEESVPPKVSSPFLTELVFVGSKDTETRLAEMAPWLKRLSVTVGILSLIDGDSEPVVRFVGPILRKTLSKQMHMDRSPRSP